MTTTVTKPVRKINSFVRLSPTMYEVVGSTGNKYLYDSWLDCCNCPAGRNGTDCYHAKNVRELETEVKQEQQKKDLEYIFLQDSQNNYTGTDVIAAIRDMGLTPEFVGLVQVTAYGQMCHRMRVNHHGKLLCTLDFFNTMFKLTSAITGKEKMHCVYDRPSLNYLRENLNRVLNLKFKEARESLFGL